MTNSKAHGDREHAKYSCSSADRWIACAGAVPLTHHLGRHEDRKDSVASLRGTWGHEQAEKMLAAGDPDRKPTDAEITAFLAIGGPKPDPWEYVHCAAIYAQRVLNVVDMLGAKPTELFVEARTEVFGELCWGTVDAAIVTPDVLVVIDLKCGSGKYVPAVRNAQLMTYAAGLLETHYRPDECPAVVMDIVQPRHEAWDAGSSSWTTTADEIRAHKASVDCAVGTAESLRSSELSDPNNYTAGDHCDYCPVADQCPAHSKSVSIVEGAMPPLDDLPADKLAELVTLAQAAKVLEVSDRLAAFVKACRARLMTCADEERKALGFKLVEGQTKRRWRSGDEVIAACQARGIDPFLPAEVIGLGEAKKRGLKAAEIDELTEKPQGTPTLVPLSDRRPAIATDGSDMALPELSDE